MNPRNDPQNPDEKFELCIFGPNMEPISDTLEIEVGYLHNMEPLFFEQAQEMAQMGLNFEDCLKALKKFGGNTERAIDEVLNQL